MGNWHYVFSHISCKQYSQVIIITQVCWLEYENLWTNSESDKHYYKVLISDMTLSEHVKHKALVQEMQSIRTKGERNLMTLNSNNIIIVGYPHVESKMSYSNTPTLASNCS